MGSQTCKRLIALAAAAIVAANAPAHAQSQSDAPSAHDQQAWSACAGASQTAQARVDACTRILTRDVAQIESFALIHRGRAWKGKGDLDRAISDFTAAINADANFAYAYADRGDVYRSIGQCDAAISDYDQALRLQPDRAELYVSRGICRVRRGEHDSAMVNFEMAIRLDPANAEGVGAVAFSRKADLSAAKGEFAPAVQDYDRALTLEPGNASIHESRGIARFYLGDNHGAADDLARAFEGEPNVYAALWLYLSRARAGGRQAAPELAKAALRLGPANWPYPIVELFQGGRSAEGAQAAASTPEQRCEAHFYIGQWQLARGARGPAAQAFRAAADACAPSVVEHRAALEELKRLKP
jgi:lipoprotein NlpI